jgi:hypothetical protein
MYYLLVRHVSTYMCHFQVVVNWNVVLSCFLKSETAIGDVVCVLGSVACLVGVFLSYGLFLAVYRYCGILN